MATVAPKKPEVAVLGAESLHSIVSHGRREYEDFDVLVEHTENLRHHELEEWDIVILPYTMYLDIERAHPAHPMTGSFLRCGAQTTQIVHLEQQVRAALQKGRTICFLTQSLIGGPYPSDMLIEIDEIYEKYGFFDGKDEELKTNIIGHRILRSLRVSPILTTLTSGYQIRRVEFEKYLQSFGAGSICFKFEDDSARADVICRDAEDRVAGFCLPLGKGNLIFLPYLRHKNLDFDEAMEALASGILTYLSKVAVEEPDWVKSLVFAAEKPLLESRQRVEAEIRDLDSQLAPFKDLRAVLWQRDYALQGSVPHFLNELGFETRQDEVFEEDFWVTQDGKDIVIAEVKSMNRNVTRQDIAKLDDHRKARGMADDFPALLIANTFARRQDMKAKDERIAPNECKRAADDHVLVMRTVDLVHLYELVTQDKLEFGELLEVLLSESGWLSIDTSGWKVIKE